jgi:hypothetical protein
MPGQVRAKHNFASYKSTKDPDALSPLSKKQRKKRKKKAASAKGRRIADMNMV